MSPAVWKRPARRLQSSLPTFWPPGNLIVDEEGHRTKTHGKEGGKLWTGRTVLQVIRNPAYLGIATTQRAVDCRST
ncbi:MAG: recombinase family protein [Candidatus Thiodiazotropha sp.]